MFCSFAGYPQKENLIVFDVDFDSFKEKMIDMGYFENIKGIERDDFCGYTILNEKETIVFLNKNLSFYEQAISLFHELTHIYTIDCYSDSITNTDAYKGYLLWRELIAEYTAYACFCNYFEWQEHINVSVLENAMKSFIKYKDEYGLIELIAMIMSLKVDLDNLPFKWIYEGSSNISILLCAVLRLHVRNVPRLRPFWRRQGRCQGHVQEPVQARGCQLRAYSVLK